MARNRLPYPRIELRWRDEPDGEYHKWACDYILVLHKKRVSDIRCDSKKGACRAGVRDVEYVLNTTKRSGSSPLGWDGVTVDTPYRDGAHAKWDAAVLGNLPVFATYGKHRTDVSAAIQPEREGRGK